MGPILDTSPAAADLVARLMRNKSIGERLAMIDDAFETGRMLAMAGLKQHWPDLGPEDLELEYYRRLLGRALGDRVMAARRARGR